MWANVASSSNEMQHGPMPPPPSFFSPADLFSPEEMKENVAKMHQKFEAIGKLRQEFVKRLKQGAATTEHVGS
jgi:hypothetical protein